MARDARGRFLPNNKEGMSSTEIARERQLKSAAVRKANTAARKTLADTLRAALAENAGGGLSKMEYIVAKCLEGMAKDGCSPKDLKNIAEVLGELNQNINLSTEETGLIIGFKKADD